MVWEQLIPHTYIDIVTISYLYVIQLNDMKNILVTIDFNTNEQLLIDKAFQLAEPFDSKIWLMSVF